MIDIKTGLCLMLAGMLIITLALLGMTHYEFNKYKENVNVQTQKNVAEKARIESEQRAIYANAQIGYDGAIAYYADRLRNTPSVPRCPAVPVADSGSSSVPGKATDPEVAYVRLTTFEGICAREFYEAAMKTTIMHRELAAICK